MRIDGLHLLLAFVAVLCAIGWRVTDVRVRKAESQRDTARRVADLKQKRLDQALNERDRATRHADQAQQLLNRAVRMPEERLQHPALTVVDGGAS
jgi:hypothetical protein